MARHTAGQAGQKHKSHKGGRKRNHERQGIKQQRGRKGGKQAASIGSKVSRLQAAQYNRQKDRSKVLEERRIKSKGPPKIVALVPLCEQIDCEKIWNTFLTTAKGSENGISAEKSCNEFSKLSETTFYVPDVKVRLTLLPPFMVRKDLLALLDYVKVADTVVFLTSSDSSSIIDEDAERMCEVLRAFGLPSVFLGVQGLAKLSLAEKSAMKKASAKVFKDLVVKDSIGIFSVDTVADIQQMFRALKEQKQIIPLWRQNRPYIIVDKTEILHNKAEDGNCSVAVSGYIRGQNLSVHQVFHVPMIGDYHISKVEAVADPLGSNFTNKMEEDTLLAQADPTKYEPLVRENIPDPLAGEQTWPTEEEMIEASKGETIMHKRVPKGYSDYQAAWITSDDEGAGDENSEEDYLESEAEPELADEIEAMSEGDSLDLDHNQEEDFEEEDYATEWERERKYRRDAESENLEFPDEIEVPMDKLARERFLKYRGLKSFRTSPWDPKESLPREYAKIFAFENPKRAHKHARARLDAGRNVEGVVSKGQYVKIFISNVTWEQASRLSDYASNEATEQLLPYAVFGLLQHETKMSLLNFTVNKSSSYTEPVANKDELVFFTGIRTFRSCPIISDCAPNVDKHKNERFMTTGDRCTFSVYAPISHPPIPLLCFKEESSEDKMGEGGTKLVATGLLNSVDPDRIVLKRIVLTGYPYKVHKSRAYVRYMFHNPEDIKWFSPLELWTKYGRRGKIKEPVGTHGTMKCMFDGVVQQRDTICLSLYKRVFPKWPEATEQFLG